ncbi:ABC transporter permease [Homoserinibacter sp. GY 40078]|uniref:ABC transporter permease n=1 Tax=Homoserinibacter sp. GY 40078 TaxID=2603275 RepID=UPI0011CABDC2|nr:ABC transporter permease [Homoserinibacter sp. GY 40078]TXK19085.1 ABC transporter permease [Homoserinibacter sp. GY 40078]
MKTTDLIGTAVSNTFRSKTRTLLTVLAIFVGAFTLTLTSGLGTGINAYIDDTLAGIGASDIMTVTKNADTATDPTSTEPEKYDPDAVQSGVGPATTTVTALTPDDIDELATIDGVLEVTPVISVTPDYIETESSDPYVVSIAGVMEGQSAQLAAGSMIDDGDDLELLLPTSYVDVLGFSSAEDAVGATVTIAITDNEREQHLIDATIVGVADETLASPAGAGAVANDALTDALFDAQSTGLTDEEADRYAQATVRFADDATDDEIADLKQNLEDAGYTGTTVEDQLGAFTAVIDGIVFVLNAFAIIALLAAAFGIVNTLLMSVQERTREIGLMKAMGLGSGKVFGLFSLEATFIGFLGSAIGVVLAMLAGTALSSALSGSLLADLPGLTLIAFDPASIAVIILAVMAIAFLAGTLPAARAARADPVSSLRYE